MSVSKTTAASGSSGSPKKSFNEGFKDYIASLQYEWRKITWPEKKQWKDSTIVVFVFVIFMMVILATLDFSIGWMMNQILGLDR